MQDVLTKYIELKLSFPNKAGKLHQVLETQKRLIDKVQRQRPNDDLQALLLSVGEGYDVAMDLLQYMKLTIQGVADDAEALKPGADIRNICKLQGEEIERLWTKLRASGIV